MKINLIGMILNNAGRNCFDGAIIDDNGTELVIRGRTYHDTHFYHATARGCEAAGLNQAQTKRALEK